MRTNKGVLKPPPYPPVGEKRKLKSPERADIISFNHVPFSCRQEEQGEKDCSDRELEKQLAKQLKLSAALLKKVEDARSNGEEVFRHKFGCAGMLLYQTIFNTRSENKS